MTRSTSAMTMMLLVATLAAACEHRQLTPTAPDNPGTTTNQGTEVKSGSSGNALWADVIVGDSGCPTLPSPLAPSSLASTAPGDVTDSYHVRWAHTQGLIVRPDGSSYSLTDDVTLNVRLRTNDMALTAVTLYGQDIIGPDGVMHDTNDIAISPQAAVPTGFTLHVHASGVTVYRLSGHTGGKRVRPIGTICIGDVVYRLP